VLVVVRVGGERLDGDGEASEQRAGGFGDVHLAELGDRLLARGRIAVFLGHLRFELARLLRSRAAENVEDSHFASAVRHTRLTGARPRERLERRTSSSAPPPPWRRGWSCRAP